MEPIFELAIALPPTGSRGLLRALHTQLRAAILDGRLRPGLRLPPTRRFAVRLGVSRNTAIAAYDALLSEGYLVSRTGDGTYVADVRPRPAPAKAPSVNAVSDNRIAPLWRTSKAPIPSFSVPQCRFDFRTGFPDTTGFPFDIWQRLAGRASRALSRQSAAESEPEGRPALRQAIAHHVSFARAVACTSDDIVVTSGTRQGLDLIARILVAPGRTDVAVEDPCFPPVRAAFAASGARIRAVPVDGEGLVVSQLPNTARVICVSPSHQHPLGVAMSARRRTQVLDFAQAHNAAIIEDDYDSEFRIDGRPLDALKTLDRNQSVFYVGTFSKSMFPALRMGFVVVPPWARPALVAAKRIVDGFGPVLVQDTLAAFISEGHLGRHIRRMRKIYDERHDVLLTALNKYCTRWLSPIPAMAGVHLTAELTGHASESTIASRAAEAGIGLETLGQFSHRKSVRTGLMFGYGLIRAEDIAPAIRTLSRVLR